MLKTLQGLAEQLPKGRLGRVIGVTAREELAPG